MKRTTSLARKAERLLFSIAVLLFAAKSVRAQSALDGFDPHANDQIRVVVVQSDGKILIGGSFTSLTPNDGATITRNHIARLNVDGTIDTNFNPNASGIVYSLAVQTDGQILAGGDFATIGGATRNGIARLDATTGAADSFNPNPNNGVRAIAVQADGKILAGGLFNGANSIGGQTRNRIARLDPTTGLADSFNPNADGNVLCIALQTDGKILAGGAFGGIGGQARSGIARLNATTGEADSFNPIANNTVYAIAIQADGKILAGGNFFGANSIGGQARNRIAQLDPVTGLADSFDPKANNDLRSIVVQADGKILAGGYFTSFSPNGGGAVARTGIARLNPDGTLDSTFDPNANSDIQSIALQSDGKILAGGSFTTLAPSGGTAVARNYIARLEVDGRLDQTLDLGIVTDFGGVGSIAIQPDGKILIGGSFDSVLGVARTNIARINRDGTLDTAFDPNANNYVNSIAVQADGQILVGGDFTTLSPNGGGAVSRNHIARLNADGTLETTFDPNANHTVYSIVVQANGKILVGGMFSTLSPNGGATVTRNNIARLNTDGTLDAVFDPNANDTVNSIALQADGKILVAGHFYGTNCIGGQTRNYIARLDAVTGTADSFNPEAENYLLTIAVQQDGNILAGGAFQGIGGATRNNIARLNATTGLADSFNPNANDIVHSIIVQSDGKILVGGLFSGANSIGGATRNHIARLDAVTGAADSFDPDVNYIVISIAMQVDGKVLVGCASGYIGVDSTNHIGGQPRNRFARLNNDTAALQNLAVTQNAITWTHGESVFILTNSTIEIHGGASPQFTRVTFESSTNNLDYTFLGSGSVAAGNWTLTGLNLPILQNLYIRARGYYSSGNLNGSGSIQESVRNVFLTPIPASPRLTIQRSAATNVVLSWDTNFIGFTLEANTNLTTNVWSTVSPAPSVSGTNNIVTNAASGTARFYRLRK